MTPYPAQRAFLHAVQPGGRYCWAGCRQSSGKSESASALLTHVGLTSPCDSAIVAPSQEAPKEIIRRCLKNLRALDVEVERDSITLIEFRLPHWPKGELSRITALASNPATVRSASIGGVLLLDEAAGISPEMRTAVLPFVDAAGGAVVYMGTGGPPVGPFFEVAHDEGYQQFRVTLEDAVAAGIQPQSFLDDRRENMNETDLAREYGISKVPGQAVSFFVAAEKALLDADQVYKAFARGLDVADIFQGAF